MSPTIKIRHCLPVIDSDSDDPGITFNRWIPDAESIGLSRQSQNTLSTLWIDRSCLPSIQDADDLTHRINIVANKVWVDVDVSDVASDLAQFILDEREQPRDIHHGISPGHADYERLSAEYNSLGRIVLQEAIGILNRLIAFARNNKGQYWLRERTTGIDLMPSFNVECYAKVKTPDRDWVRWCPPGEIAISVYMHGEEIGISQTEWSAVQSFASGTKRANLVLELLANAQSLIEEDRRRSAILEAVSALEVAVARFAESPSLGQAVDSKLLYRLDVKSLSTWVKHIGFSGALKYLLPVFFSADRLSDDILKQCREAIEIRGAVAHQGKRHLDAVKARRLLTAVRSMCKLLIAHTAQSQSDE